MSAFFDTAHPDVTQIKDYCIVTGEDIPNHNEVTDFFYRFWLSLCEGGRKPSRNDVKPAALKQFLDRVVLLDVTEHAKSFALNVRLIGTYVSTFYGEIAGQDIQMMDNKDAAARIYNSCRVLLENKEPVLSITSGIAKDKKHLKGYALYVPLFDTAGKIDKIMVSVDILPSAR